MARIGIKLYYLRTRERRLSQQAVALAIGIRQATISHVEQGVSLPSCTLLLELSQFYDVSPTFLLDEERGVVPRATERWATRNALVTVGMWIEAPRDALVETPDSKQLCPLLQGESFYDDEAAGQRRGRKGDAARRAIRSQHNHRLTEEEAIEKSLEQELLRHPKRRADRAE